MGPIPQNKVIYAKPASTLIVTKMIVRYNCKEIHLNFTSLNGSYVHHEESGSDVLRTLTKEEKKDVVNMLINL